jgi:putative Holliday junction resolvase
LGRIIAIDYGRKRVGIAVTDPLQMIANALTTIHSKDIWTFLAEYMEKEAVDCIVVGYPKQMNNQASEAVRFINPFLRRLTKLYPEMEVKLVDERFTSKIAHQTMREAGLKKKARQNKALVDTISATIILQSYLEQRTKY